MVSGWREIWIIDYFVGSIVASATSRFFAVICRVFASAYKVFTVTCRGSAVSYRRYTVSYKGSATASELSQIFCSFFQQMIQYSKKIHSTLIPLMLVKIQMKY